MEEIQAKRISIWNNYYQGLNELGEQGLIKLPQIPQYATNNAHMFYIICRSYEERTALIKHMKEKDIHPVFHYLSLNKSEYFLKDNPQIDIPNSDSFTDRLLRLPFYYELSETDQDIVLTEINSFYLKK